MRRLTTTRTTGALLAAVMTALAGGPVADRAGAMPDQQPAPDVVLILLDDATVEDVRHMPRVQDLLVEEGTTFARNYVPMPQCCPARATVLTGLYPHNHGVVDITAPLGGFAAFDDRSTLATYLDPTYATFILGKYMNELPDGYQAPGWDDWRVPTRATTYDYRHQDLQVNGSVEQLDGYVPTLYGGQVLDFLDSASEEPFFAYVNWVAPHDGGPRDDVPGAPFVSRRYRGSYDGPRLPLAASFAERDVSDKPAAVRGLPRVGRRAVQRIEEVLVARRESLQAVDRQVGRVVDRLDSLGRLDDAYVILTSDNGFMQGQHRITYGKLQPYEPSARVPLVVRGPGFAPGATYRSVTGLQDLVPTILDLTATDLPPQAPQPDGLSLAGLLDGSVTTARAQLLEIARNTRNQAGRVVPTWAARGIVTDRRWKYVEYPESGETELYDLTEDPDELTNLAHRPRFRDQRDRLASRLEGYQDCAGPTCSS